MTCPVHGEDRLPQPAPCVRGAGNGLVTQGEAAGGGEEEQGPRVVQAQTEHGQVPQTEGYEDHGVACPVLPGACVHSLAVQVPGRAEGGWGQ